jgi:hypothetical protein
MMFPKSFDTDTILTIEITVGELMNNHDHALAYLVRTRVQEMAAAAMKKQWEAERDAQNAA